jgi:hypothetical protein
VPIALVQSENDYSAAPTRDLGAELARLGKPHVARVFPGFGLTADEGHLFFQNGAPIWGPWVRRSWTAGSRRHEGDARRLPRGSHLA